MSTAPATYAYTRIRQLERALEQARPFVAAYGIAKPAGARLLAADAAAMIDAALRRVKS